MWICIGRPAQRRWRHAPKIAQARHYSRKKRKKSNIFPFGEGVDLDENPRRDLIISALPRFGLTILLCSLPFLKFGVGPTTAGLGLLIFFPCSFMLSKPVMGVTGKIGTFFCRQPHSRWQMADGRVVHDPFANARIRLMDVGRELWGVDTDLPCVIGERPTPMPESLYDAHPYAVIPATRFHGFSPDDAEKGCG